MRTIHTFIAAAIFVARAAGQLGVSALQAATDAIPILISDKNQCEGRVTTVMAAKFIVPGACQDSIPSFGASTVADCATTETLDECTNSVLDDLLPLVKERCFCTDNFIQNLASVFDTVCDATIFTSLLNNAQFSDTLLATCPEVLQQASEENLGVLGIAQAAELQDDLAPTPTQTLEPTPAALDADAQTPDAATPAADGDAPALTLPPAPAPTAAPTPALQEDRDINTQGLLPGPAPAPATLAPTTEDAPQPVMGPVISDVPPAPEEVATPTAPEEAVPPPVEAVPPPEEATPPPEEVTFEYPSGTPEAVIQALNKSDLSNEDIGLCLDGLNSVDEALVASELDCRQTLTGLETGGDECPDSTEANNCSKEQDLLLGMTELLDAGCLCLGGDVSKLLAGLGNYPQDHECDFIVDPVKSLLFAFILEYCEGEPVAEAGQALGNPEYMKKEDDEPSNSQPPLPEVTIPEPDEDGSSVSLAFSSTVLLAVLVSSMLSWL